MTNTKPIDGKIVVPGIRVYSLSVGLTGGFLAGLAMALLGMFESVLVGKPIWYPANLVAAVMLRDLQSARPQQLVAFSLHGLLIGALIHFTLSAGIGALFTVLFPGLVGNPLVWGITFIVAPVLWMLDSLTLSMLNPVMFQSVEPIAFWTDHLVFGLVLAWWIAWRKRPDTA